MLTPADTLSALSSPLDPPAPARIAMIGGGSWATALTKILSENGHTVHWWLRAAADVKYLREFRHNPRYLSGVVFDLRRVLPSTDLRATLAAADWVVLAVPAAFVVPALRELTPEAFAGKTIISAIKGMVPERNVLVTDWMRDHFQVPSSHLAVVAGPCHAEEVALEKHSYLTIGGPDLARTTHFAALLRNRYVRCAASADLDGIEYCAVMKNIIALTCGIAHGLGYGDNFQAVMVSNALQEIARFLHEILPMDRDLAGSAYLGDLLVTAYSQFSRNRTFGNMIGRGYSVKSAQMEMNMVAEGYYAVRSVWELNRRLRVRMPITDAAYNILYERIAPAVELEILREQFA